VEQGCIDRQASEPGASAISKEAGSCGWARYRPWPLLWRSARGPSRPVESPGQSAWGAVGARSCGSWTTPPGQPRQAQAPPSARGPADLPRRLETQSPPSCRSDPDTDQRGAEGLAEPDDAGADQHRARAPGARQRSRRRTSRPSAVPAAPATGPPAGRTAPPRPALPRRRPDRPQSPPRHSGHAPEAAHGSGSAAWRRPPTGRGDGGRGGIQRSGQRGGPFRDERRHGAVLRLGDRCGLEPCARAARPSPAPRGRTGWQPPTRRRRR
jgi:hypothetical protein